jgi:MFS family permease
MKALNPDIKISFRIALLFFCRIFGLISLLPIILVQVTHMPSYTPLRGALAIGSYGFVQALMQIPLGYLSDRYGRKSIIFLGLTFMFLGTLLGFFAKSITTLILARCLQGFGAIGSTCLALLFDFISYEYRSIAMLIVGVMIGLSFFSSMIIGSWINAIFGLKGVFLLSLLFIFFAFLNAIKIFKQYSQKETCLKPYMQIASKSFISLFENKKFVFCLISVFVLHAFFARHFSKIASFIGNNQLNITWSLTCVSLLAVLISFMILGKFRNKENVHLILQISNVFFLISFLFYADLGFINNKLIFLAFFLVAFTIMETMLPTIVSSIFDQSLRGVSMGIYSSCQYLGIFVGSLMSGYTGFTNYYVYFGFLFCLFGFLAQKILFERDSIAQSLIKQV